MSVQDQPYSLDAQIAVAIGEQSIVADFDEARRENMQTKAAHELGLGQGHGFPMSTGGIILVTKGDRFCLGVARRKPMIGDSDAVGVA